MTPLPAARVYATCALCYVKLGNSLSNGTEFTFSFWSYSFCFLRRISSVSVQVSALTKPAMPDITLNSVTEMVVDIIRSIDVNNYTTYSPTKCNFAIP